MKKIVLVTVSILIANYPFFFPDITNSKPLYKITDLGTLGGEQSIANAINKNGEVVGTSNIVGEN